MAVRRLRAGMKTEKHKKKKCGDQIKEKGEEKK